MSHTPGPWVTDGGEVRTIDGDMIAWVTSPDETKDSTGRTRDNAVLIASAPRLLKALKLAVEYLPSQALTPDGQRRLDLIRSALTAVDRLPVR